jgi:hypothetical protein
MSTAQNFMKDIEQWGFINVIYFGGVLVYAGIIFIADSLGFLPQIGDSSAWSWIFLGAGLASLIGNLIRQASPNIINPSAFDYVFGAVLLAIGLGGFISLYIALSVLLLLVGGVILYRALVRTRKAADKYSYKVTAEGKKTQEDQGTFDMASCMAMMEKMTGGHWEGCDCDKMMSQITDQEDIPEEWQSVMSQMMEFHCEPQEDSEKI